MSRFLTRRNSSANRESRDTATQQSKGFAGKLGAALAQRVAPESGPVPDTTALLLDLSGSMWRHAGGTSRQSRLEALADIVAGLPYVRRFGFSNGCLEIPLNQRISEIWADLDFGSGTDLAAAFDTIKAAKVTTAILITDGLPDNDAAALIAATGLKLHIFYVGPEPVPAFLQDLARAVNGTFETGRLSQPLALTTRIAGFLPAPAPCIKL